MNTGSRNMEIQRNQQKDCAYPGRKNNSAYPGRASTVKTTKQSNLCECMRKEATEVGE
jgi:hypothetical protein